MLVAPLHQGQPRHDFRKAWVTACARAGYPEMLRHDTAVRNMVNRSIPQRVAMTITGHRTRSVFDRYHIVSPTDLQEAARKLGEPSSAPIAPRGPVTLINRTQNPTVARG